jgi:outer membrane protein OmpA-like peptidoglycan-associated protein
MIESVVLEPSGRLDTREHDNSVTVTMTGDEDLVATFDVEGLFANRPMEEIEPGVYVGSFDVGRGQSGDFKVVGRLTHPPSGANQQLAAGSPLQVYISPAPPPVAVDKCTPEMVESFDAVLRSATIYFQFSEHALTEEAKGILNENKDAIGSHEPCTIYVLGHTDEIGNPKQNEVLSMLRAVEVVRHLGTLGIPGNRVEKLYFGESQPASKDKTDEAMARNRRVELRAVNPY